MYKDLNSLCGKEISRKPEHADQKLKIYVREQLSLDLGVNA